MASTAAKNVTVLSSDASPPRNPYSKDTMESRCLCGSLVYVDHCCSSTYTIRTPRSELNVS
eukprot:1623195-Amphidinium_carterae.2